MSAPLEVASFQELWPEGFNQLREALVLAGFSDLEWESNEAHEAAFAKLSPRGLQHYYKQEGGAENSWGYLTSEARNAWPENAALMFVHPARRKDLPESYKGNLFWTQWPEAALDWLLRKLWPETSKVGKAASQIAASAVLEEGVRVGADCVIGEDCFLESGVRLGARVQLGRGCRIGANTSISDDTVIGDFCRIGSSTAIGGRGLGAVAYPPQADGGASHKQIRKHVGRVRLGSFVDIGSSCGIDRAVFGETVLEDRVLLDNQVQIAHNCVVGEGSILCAFVGLSGSTTVGRNCVLAGAVGTNGHLKIGDNVTIGGQSGVTVDIDANQMVKGYPPRPIREALRIENLKTRLPELYSRLKAIEKAVGLKR